MTTVLITYATKAGSTFGVAEKIADTLRSEGLSVTLRQINDVIDPSQFDAVIIGSAIRGGKWLPAASNFVEKHVSRLVDRPVVYFTVCLTLHEDTPANREEVYAYTDPVRQVLTPQAEGLFAGVMDYKVLSLPIRLLVRSMKAPEGDYRDWDSIEAWAQRLVPVLTRKPEGIL